jgi:PAS domain S-box-containing protein
VNDASQIIRDEKAEIKYYAGYIQDISKLKQYELELQFQKERFALAVDGSNDGLWDWNPQTNEVYFSARWKEMLGCQEDEILNNLQEWSSRVHPDDVAKAFEAVQAHIEGKTKVYENEHRMQHKDGRWIWILDRGKALLDKEGKAQRFVGFHTDITQQKEQEEILKQKIQEALEENTKQLQILQEQSKMASMGEMIGAIAHQWRQPLNSIGLNIQNLRYEYKSGALSEAFVEKFIEDNFKTIRFMSKTIDDFRSFFRVDKVKKEFDVKEAIQAVVDMQSAQMKHHNIELDLQGETFVYLGLQSEYQQVILNLLNNAKDALEENSIEKPKINIHIKGKKITIQDNAGGIRDDVLRRVFEPYFTTKEQGKGTGMGLYISKIIIEENMNGKLSVENVDGGAMFMIDFGGDVP